VRHLGLAPPYLRSGIPSPAALVPAFGWLVEDVDVENMAALPGGRWMIVHGSGPADHFLTFAKLLILR
jgi:hypothetical protein